MEIFAGGAAAGAQGTGPRTAGAGAGASRGAGTQQTGGSSRGNRQHWEVQAKGVECLKLLVSMGILIYQLCHSNPAFYVLILRASIHHTINLLMDQWVKLTSKAEN